jgi:hypothetical protein
MTEFTIMRECRDSAERSYECSAVKTTTDESEARDYCRLLNEEYGSDSETYYIEAEIYEDGMLYGHYTIEADEA